MMMRYWKIVGTLFCIGAFFGYIPPAQAVFGIRAARAVLAARRAEKAMNDSEEKKKDPATARVSSDTSGQAPDLESEDPNVEKLRQLEAGSRKQG